MVSSCIVANPLGITELAATSILDSHRAATLLDGHGHAVNAAVIIPSHPRKNASGDKKLELSAPTKTEFFESLMGSSHFINSTGNLWALERNEEHDRITFVGGRQRSEGGDRTLYIQYDAGNFTVLDDAEANRDNVLNTEKRRQAWDLLPR